VPDPASSHRRRGTRRRRVPDNRRPGDVVVTRPELSTIPFRSSSTSLRKPAVSWSRLRPLRASGSSISRSTHDGPWWTMRSAN
jgi:hypothetical protein